VVFKSLARGFTIFSEVLNADINKTLGSQACQINRHDDLFLNSLSFKFKAINLEIGLSSSKRSTFYLLKMCS